MLVFLILLLFSLVNMQTNIGITAIYLACQNGDLDILKYLVSKNGATKIKAYDAMSCLHAAAQMGRLEVVQWLVRDYFSKLLKLSSYSSFNKLGSVCTSLFPRAPFFFMEDD